MRNVRLGALVGALTTPALLSAVSMTAGLGIAGWLAGLAAGWGLTTLLVAGRARSGRPEILPADWVTLARALLSAGVAGLVAGSFHRALAGTTLVALSAAALALDGVDGQVARRTGTATPFGGRLDGEVDAFLILALSVAVARDYGGWVLAIGAARYAFLVAGWAVRWLAAPLPPRYWRKVVAAVQGIALTAAVSGLVPRLVGMAAVAVALALLTESFGRDVVWLYRTAAGERSRRVVRRATSVAAVTTVWAALVAPNIADRLTLSGFAAIPVEGLLLVGLGLLLPPLARRVLAVVAGVAVGLLGVVKLLDAGFYDEIGRRFDPVLDWGNIGPAIGVVRDSIGTAATVAAVVLAGLAILLFVAAVTAATLRVSALTGRYPGRSAGAVATLAVAWTACATLSLQLVPGTALASTRSTDLIREHVQDSEASVRDARSFAAAGHDPYADIPAAQLLDGLRGKDVVVAFVESYGQVAVQGTTFSPGVDAVLRAGTTTLAHAGFSARSAWLTSPTFGGISWLAHSTLQSGLWIDDQHRYQTLVSSDRFTLSDAFGKAGWRTVADVPSDDRPWPQGTSFYHYDQIYDRLQVGYHGPTFSYASMPDQYSLAAFQRLELAPGHEPLFAEIDLVSSHTPWTPLPSMVPWDRVGDGSVFDPMPAQGLTPAVAWQNTDTVRRLYGQSVQYSLQALTSWVAQLHDPDLVLVLLGDHQPATKVSGSGAGHEVPISVVASDPGVLDQISSWHWQDGLLPSPTAPLWRMDAFRNRFLDAFSGKPAVDALPPTR